MKADALRARRGPRGGGRPGGRRHLAGGGHRRARPPSCAAHGVDARDARDGRPHARGARRSPSAEGRRRGVDAEVAATAARRGAREARHRDGAARHEGPRPGARARRRPRHRRPDDPLRDRRRARRRPLPRAARGLPAFVAEVRPRPDLLVHAANSAATLRDPASHFDMVRCGVAIYGLDPFQEDPAAHGLEPALSLQLLGGVACGASSPATSAGYGRRWRAEEPTWVATVPVGYGDGWRRALTNNCDVLIGGRRHPLVGTVSMDNVTVALGPEPTCGRGRRGGADRRSGRGADTCRGGGAAAGHDQLRGHQRPRAADAPRAVR